MDKAERFAWTMGKLLQQSYGVVDGRWWLHTRGAPIRPLEDHEVAWHVARGHAPFVAGGIDVDDPRWFEDPEE